MSAPPPPDHALSAGSLAFLEDSAVALAPSEAVGEVTLAADGAPPLLSAALPTDDDDGFLPPPSAADVVADDVTLAADTAPPLPSPDDAMFGDIDDGFLAAATSAGTVAEEGFLAGYDAAPSDAAPPATESNFLADYDDSAVDALDDDGFLAQSAATAAALARVAGLAPEDLGSNPDGSPATLSAETAALFDLSSADDLHASIMMSEGGASSPLDLLEPPSPAPPMTIRTLSMEELEEINSSVEGGDVGGDADLKARLALGELSVPRTPDDDDESGASSRVQIGGMGFDPSHLSSPLGTELLHRKVANQQPGMGGDWMGGEESFPSDPNQRSSPFSTELLHRKVAFQQQDGMPDPNRLTSPLGTALLQKKMARQGGGGEDLMGGGADFGFGRAGSLESISEMAAFEPASFAEGENGSSVAAAIEAAGAEGAVAGATNPHVDMFAGAPSMTNPHMAFAKCAAAKAPAKAPGSHVPPRRVRHLFKRLDTDCSGGLDFEELTSGFALEFSVTALAPHVLEKMSECFDKVASVDERGARSLKINVFSRFYCEVLFRHFDADDSGTLEVSEVAAALKFLTKPNAQGEHATPVVAYPSEFTDTSGEVHLPMRWFWAYFKSMEVVIEAEATAMLLEAEATAHVSQSPPVDFRIGARVMAVPPGDEPDEADARWVPGRVLSEREREGAKQFKISLDGYDSEDDQWVESDDPRVRPYEAPAAGGSADDDAALKEAAKKEADEARLFNEMRKEQARSAYEAASPHAGANANEVDEGSSDEAAASGDDERLVIAGAFVATALDGALERANAKEVDEGLSGEAAASAGDDDERLAIAGLFVAAALDGALADMAEEDAHPPPASATFSAAFPDPFSAPPMMGGDPFAAPTSASDPFAAVASASDPFAASSASDPFAAVASASDPFAAASTHVDPFAPPAPARDIFVTVDSFADSFAASADPFATATADVSFSPAEGDPFAAAAPADNNSDPFAAAAPADNNSDPFAAAAPADNNSDPFAAAAPGDDPFASAADVSDPFETHRPEPVSPLKHGLVGDAVDSPNANAEVFLALAPGTADATADATAVEELPHRASLDELLDAIDDDNSEVAPDVARFEVDGGEGFGTTRRHRRMSTAPFNDASSAFAAAEDEDDDDTLGEDSDGASPKDSAFSGFGNQPDGFEASFASTGNDSFGAAFPSSAETAFEPPASAGFDNFPPADGFGDAYERPRGTEELKLSGKLDLTKLQAIKREKPTSPVDFTFRIVTAAQTIKISPGGKEAFTQWQEGLTMAVSVPSPVEQRAQILRRESMSEMPPPPPVS